MKVKSVTAINQVKTRVILEAPADAGASLRGAEALEMAKQAATAAGRNPRGLSNTPTVYPVNEKGETTDQVALGQEAIAAYEAEFVFSAGL